MNHILSDWIERSPDDWRRYWNPILVDGVPVGELDLAAIVGKPAVDVSVAGLFGLRTFSPEGEEKWIREGDSITIEGAKNRADQLLRARYGIPPLKQDKQ